MPVIIRGRRVMFLQSQPGDGPKPMKLPPCQYCGKPEHSFAREWGCHLGNSIFLSEAILQGKEPESHPWYTGRWSIAAHHLICSEAMADEDWARYCRQFCYDINRRLNGIILPSRMDVACELRVPLHRGNHAAGWAHDVHLAYPKAVSARLAEVADLIESGAFCSKPEALVSELDALSAFILVKVASFTWTLSSDGLDYRDGGAGCSGVRSITDKPQRTCPQRRRHGAVHGVSRKPLVRRALAVGE
ncbi:AHH domain-containing protein [Pyxidicoccus parkwayensis]|uniref:AHH domain-containing protein n=2 Tax=Pyxidicoccus parkwayensis TaxID=2813578 RepID=A0ABX7NIY3_9BACT|nr:AHH domain-containing protein [Pyxidicoccus parkwaysis]